MNCNFIEFFQDEKGANSMGRLMGFGSFIIGTAIIGWWGFKIDINNPVLAPTVASISSMVNWFMATFAAAYVSGKGVDLIKNKGS